MVILKKSEALQMAVTVLKKGGVVICPTDTVYGFLADAESKKAVAKIYKIKNRPKNKPLPIFVSSLKMAKELAEIDAKQEKILTLRDASGQAKYWPGKYTFILNSKLNQNSKLKIQNLGNTIALRIPKDVFLQKLLRKINRPLAQTSANLSGQEPLKTAEQITVAFGKSRLVGLIVTSSKPLGGKPSKIIDLTGEKLTRLR